MELPEEGRVRDALEDGPKKPHLIILQAVCIPGRGMQLRNNMYLELRCKLPRNNAGYGAFWTVSRKVGDWKPEDLLEIDMFEFIAAREKTRLWSGLWWHDFRAKEIHKGIPPQSMVKRSDDHFFIKQRVYKAHHGHGHHIKENKVNFYEFFTFGLKVTDDEFFWYLTQDGPAWKSDPYFHFSGGKVKNRTYGKVKDFEWEREVPEKLTCPGKFKLCDAQCQMGRWSRPG